jgi:hypothetical protein
MYNFDRTITDLQQVNEDITQVHFVDFSLPVG